MTDVVVSAVILAVVLIGGIVVWDQRTESAYRRRR